MSRNALAIVLVSLLSPKAGALATALPTTGLLTQYRSDSGVTTSGSDVTTWTDLAGGDNNASTGGLSNPVLATATTLGYHNNYPVISFNGSQDLVFTISNANTMSGVSIFVIGNTGAAHNAYENVISTGGPSGSGGVRWGFGMGSAGSQGMGWAGAGAGVDLGSGSSISTNTWHMLSWVSDQTAWAVRNEYPTSTAVANPADTSFFTGTWNGVLGTEVDANSTYAFSGQVAEILIYNHAVTGSEYDNVIAYLNEQYFTEILIPEPGSGLLFVLAIFGLLRLRQPAE